MDSRARCLLVIFAWVLADMANQPFNLGDTRMRIKEIKEIKALVQRVPHQRKRTGMLDSGPNTYVRFVYACKSDCVRCALDKIVRRG